MNNTELQKKTSKFLEILQSRGISGKVAKLFEIGLLLGNEVIGYFPYDIPEKFQGKKGLIFPIKNLYKEIVSFYLRYPKGTVPKYDSLPFSKDLLFGLEHSFPFIYKRGVILVEGPFDVMVLMSHGILNVCSPLGTSLSFFQLCLLRRFTTKCTILFDGDNMGKIKAAEVAEKMTKFGFECKVVSLPFGMDPDDYVLKYGKEKLLANI